MTIMLVKCVTPLVAAAGWAEGDIDIGWGAVALMPITFILLYLRVKYDNFELTMLHSPRRGGKAYWTAVTIFLILWIWAFLNIGSFNYTAYSPG